MPHLKDYLRLPTGFVLRVIVGLLAGLLVLPQLALGAIAPWARLSLFLVAVALFSLWILQAARSGHLRFRRDPVWWFLLAFWALLFIQVLPLPESVASRVSGIARLERLDNLALGGEHAATISISPYDTGMSMLRFAAFTLIFVVAANTIRRRSDVKLLLFALLAAGTIETLYGFSAYFSGQRYPPWIPGRGPLDGVMGTFPHKNYFSAFLEMAVPVAIGFLVYLGRERRDGQGPGSDRPARPLISRISDPVLFQQAILVIGVVVMISGIAFSLCRAGVFVLLATLAAFLVILGLSRLSKTSAIVVLLITGLAAASGAAIGMDNVLRRVEDAGSRQSGSWLHRLDMARNATGIVRDFPLFGTGLGTSGQIFTRYQSSQHADLQVRYFHNDVLQLLCETGFIGWLIFLAGGAWLLVRISVDLRRRRDPFSKWVGTGALLGVGAMLLHSFFEHNLGKVTSNGIVFTVLLAIAWACSRGIESRRPEERRDWLRVDLGRPLHRVALAGGAAIACVLAFVVVLPLIRAELALNRAAARTGRPDPYFFLPTAAAAKEPEAGPGMALAIAPSNHRYQFSAAVQALAAAEETVRKGAVALLGLEPVPSDGADLDKIVQVLLRNLPPGLAAARTAELSAAKRHLDAAVRLAPAIADYHLLRGVTQYELDSTSPEVLREADAAVRLAPRVPRILFGAGNLFLNVGWEKTGSERDVLWNRARALFRESLLIDPAYAAQVYPAIPRAFGVAGLIEVTPPTIRASEALYKVLWKENKWEEALSLVREMERLASARFRNDAEAVVDPDEEAASEPADDEDDMASIGKGFDRRTEEDLRRSLAQRESLLLGILGRWQERRTASARYRRLLREDSTRQMQEVSALRRKGRSDEALRRCQAVLEKDWSHPAALLEAADLSTLPGVRTDDTPWNGTLDHLYRLVLFNEELAAADLQRLAGILERYVPRSEPEKAGKIFIGGAAAVLAGRPEEGVRVLERLAADLRTAEMPWGQGHLIWYYLGNGQEKVGKKQAAISSYQQALELVPNHLPSLLRLAALGTGDSGDLARLAPEVDLDVPFGGRITLLGYSLKRAASGPGGGSATITLFWQFTERTETRYKPLVRIGAFNSPPIFANRNAILKGSVPYRTDAPKSGEVVTESYPLPSSLAPYMYLRAAMQIPGSPLSLYHDLGNGAITAALK